MRGLNLLNLCKASNIKEAEAIDGAPNPVQSLFYDPDCEFGRSGYTKRNLRIDPDVHRHLDQAYKDPDLLIDKSKDISRLYIQDKPFHLSGRQTVDKPTRASFQNIANVEAGSVVGLGNVSPAAVIQAPYSDLPPGSLLPDLKQWSDIVWLQFVQNGGNGKDIKWCFRENVNKKDARRTVAEALSRRGMKSLGTYNDKVTLTMDLEEGQAILGTENGAGCAYLVAQHKAQLGIKTITEVTIWSEVETTLRSYDPPMFSMYFTVKPYSGNGKVKAREL